MSKKALLVGINYVDDPESQLRGCINDISDMRSYLYTQGYRDFYLLHDAPMTMTPAVNTRELHFFPSRANIEQGLHWLVDNCKAGDSLFFHYSGHGSSLKDINSDEMDGYDECLVPCDYNEAGFIIDDTLRQILVPPIAATGARLRSILDCCHSGTGIDLKYNLRVNSRSQKNIENVETTPPGPPPLVPIQTPVPILPYGQYLISNIVSNTVYNELSKWFGSDAVVQAYFLCHQQQLQALQGQYMHIPMAEEQQPSTAPNDDNDCPLIEWEYGNCLDSMVETTISEIDTRGIGASSSAADIIMISGCLDKQTSADAYLDERYRGALTTAFLALVSQQKKPFKCTAILSQLHKFMKENDFDQRPQLSSERPFLGTSIFNV